MNHITSPHGCTFSTCPDYQRHVRQRYEWATVRNLYRPTGESAAALQAARDELIGDAYNRVQARHFNHQQELSA